MNEKKSLQDICGDIAEKAGVTKKLSENFVRTLFELVEEAIEKDGIAKIPNFGTFKIVAIDERKSVNVQDGSEMIIPAHKKISFTPEKSLKEEINKPYAHLETYVLKDDGPVDLISEEDEEEIEGAVDKINTDITIESSMSNSISDVSETGDKTEENVQNTTIDDSILVSSPTSDVKNTISETETNSVATTSEQVSSDDLNHVNNSDMNNNTADVNEEKKIEVIEETSKEDTSDSEQTTEEVIAQPTINASSNDNSTITNSNEMENNTTNKEEKTEEVKSESENIITNNPSQVDNKKSETKNYKWLLWLVLGALVIIAGLFVAKGLLTSKTENTIPPVPTETKVEETPKVENQPESQIEEDEIEETTAPTDCFENPQECTNLNVENTEVETTQESITNSEKHSFDAKLVQYMNQHHQEVNFPSTVEVKENYVVKEGSRLAQISRNVYDGVFQFWVYIYYYNTDILSSPDAVKPGMTLKIPDLGNDFVDPTSKTCIKLANDVSANLIK